MEDLSSLRPARGGGWGLGLWLLARPGNAAMAAVGAVLGAWWILGGAVLSVGVLLGVASAFVGVAGANALNDYVDREIDRRAHPNRAIPRGLVSPGAALRTGAFGLALGVGLASAANPAAGLWALALALFLVAYETGWKERGLAGHAMVSGAVAGTFVLGAFAALVPWGTFTLAGLAPISGNVRWWGVFAMALLAFLANLARELYKSVQDMEFDLAWRPTVAHAWGAERVRTTAGLVLAGTLVLVVVPVWREVLPNLFLVWVVPALLAFGSAPWTVDAGRASQRVKVGMVLSLFAFLAIVLI